MKNVFYSLLLLVLLFSGISYGAVCHYTSTTTLTENLDCAGIALNVTEGGNLKTNGYNVTAGSMNISGTLTPEGGVINVTGHTQIDGTVLSFNQTVFLLTNMTVNGTIDTDWAIFNMSGNWDFDTRGVFIGSSMNATVNFLIDSDVIGMYNHSQHFDNVTVADGVTITLLSNMWVGGQAILKNDVTITDGAKSYDFSLIQKTKVIGRQPLVHNDTNFDNNRIVFYRYTTLHPYVEIPEGTYPILWLTGQNQETSAYIEYHLIGNITTTNDLVVVNFLSSNYDTNVTTTFYTDGHDMSIGDDLRISTHLSNATVIAYLNDSNVFVDDMVIVRANTTLHLQSSYLEIPNDLWMRDLVTPVSGAAKLYMENGTINITDNLFLEHGEVYGGESVINALGNVAVNMSVGSTLNNVTMVSDVAPWSSLNISNLWIWDNLFQIDENFELLINEKLRIESSGEFVLFENATLYFGDTPGVGVFGDGTFTVLGTNGNNVSIKSTNEPNPTHIPTINASELTALQPFTDVDIYTFNSIGDIINVIGNNISAIGAWNFSTQQPARIDTIFLIEDIKELYGKAKANFIAMVNDTNGDYLNTANCNITLINARGEILKNQVEMSYLDGSYGLYNYSYVFANKKEAHLWQVLCEYRNKTLMEASEIQNVEKDYKPSIALVATLFLVTVIGFIYKKRRNK